MLLPSGENAMDEGRERIIVSRARYEAVRYLDRLPEAKRPNSDIDDMLELLNSRYSQLFRLMTEAEKFKPLPPPIARLVQPTKPSEDEPAQ